MGRIRRQRRYKSCDPFSKKKNSKEEKFNLPPKRKETDDVHFEKTKSFQYFQAKMDGAKLNKDVKKDEEKKKNSEKELKTKSGKVAGKTATPKAALEKLPNETTKKYFQRLDRNVQEAINTAMIDTRTLRKKRKKHLQARDEKLKNKSKKNKNKAQAGEFSALKDNVAFGDVVDHPPSLVAPRKAPVQRKPYSDLKLSAMLGAGKKSTDTVKKRKEMTSIERENFDNDRQAAIDAYRLHKKRKEMSKETT